MEDQLSLYYSKQLFQQEAEVLTPWPAWGAGGGGGGPF